MSRAIEQWGQHFSQGQDGHLAIEDHRSSDAFGRLRISTPVGLFDANFTPYYDTDMWDASVANNGAIAHDATARTANLTVDGTNGSVAILQSRQYLHYQPGRSHFILMTFSLGAAPGANVTQRVGYFDASDGIYLERTAAGMRFVLRSSTGSGTQTVEQADWNIDPMGGNNHSHSNKTLDLTKNQILVIDFQWLGVGMVRVGFDIDGEIFWCHAFKHANTTLVLPYMRTGSLPVRYEIRNTAAGVAGSMKAICASVATEGGMDVERGKNWAIGATTARDITNRRALISFRTTLDWDDVANNHVFRGRMEFEQIDTLAFNNAGNGHVQWEIVYNPTLTTAGGALTWARQTGSAIEYCLHGDANNGAFTAGTSINRWLSGSSTAGQSGVKVPYDAKLNITQRWPVAANIAGDATRVISLVAQSLSGSTPTAIAVVNWREIY